ncbi:MULTISPECIES: hypothetical protein [Bradyrhizobium]|jgi:hypothetical protein|uniref:hypothetical protein n=1 Tax=Bradyrhizobium TaxID=374 RepID=UPI000396A6C2|nr:MULTISPECIES: hypothetical protein [Bradyrhizobium]ERF86652.1 MAG: hypothetical protein C207_00147 [Bradyrhizobium sp. DFCI-1]
MASSSPTEGAMLALNLLRVSVVLFLVGLGLGIGMGVAENFTLAPAHAHLNLLGFVALFLAGLYYHVFPAAATGPLARIQAWLSVIGAVIFPIGIAAIRIGGPAYQPVVVVGSLIVFAGAILFAFIVFRGGARRDELESKTGVV